MHTPPSILWIKRLLYARFVIMGIIIILAFIYIATQPTSGFFYGFGKAFINKGIIHGDNASEDYGRVIGYNLIPGLLFWGMLWSVARKKITNFYVFFALDLLTTLGQLILPVFPIAILILSLQRPAKDYFNKKIEYSEFDSI